ncbi:MULTISPECIES: anhydro-N-acetylmuramic acid kinase [unclassified Lysobacter]|uniref:anhydro-N-acetylmuramic acid kinase n=1 Tax=unclassified Lysobacter TaxID=2635362 RepID=UPI001BE83D63|nr:MULTISPECIES: anhydro-N-acetylmuramic acid kinase [unclassified Lysobacter]MBT2745644.1 anhydro-N-acetylmuramic acid kinase [Lysobacter sp. ISL-42]MBT2749797.1 anhydro-N-acetylmuramic acid kinase [Lysobacter sp. ISL-50]MBT2777484.1 anhydro-N-acetylmuramic acid kinase [Lysobacter sp. ISL-54]MBT2781972.1 anhydro-N-acetylmuramic acid kinase [Lysobacter sp. ISL-52]
MIGNSSIPAATDAGKPPSGLYLGLISGTSADGIDAALVRFQTGAEPTRCELLLGRTYAWDEALRERLVALGQGGDARSLEELGTLDIQVAEAFADAARALIDEAGVTAAEVQAIGSHGQTVRHRPAGARYDGQHPFTWQIGDGAVIAERSGIATVADFRRRDVAAGGHGAPLMPAFHAALLHSPKEDRAALNLGGIANFTLLPARGEVRGFDTGPANCLMDAWALRHLGQAFDADGAFAAQGQIDTALLTRLLDEPWFAQPPPKSTGREQFQLAWVQSRLRGGERPQDVQASLLELSAITIADAMRAHQPATKRVLVCGGGVRNRALLDRLAAQLPGVAVESTAAFGLDPDFVEAMGFAWLARQTVAGLPGNLPSVTGARGLRVLGTVHPAA